MRAVHRPTSSGLELPPDSVRKLAASEATTPAAAVPDTAPAAPTAETGAPAPEPSDHPVTPET